MKKGSLKHSSTIQQFRRKVQDAHRGAARIAQVEGVKFFKSSWAKQGWEDDSLEKWQPRKGEAGGSVDDKIKGRALLVKSGALRRSPRRGNLGRNDSEVVSDLPYAKIHNEGGRIRGNQNVRAHHRKTRKGRVQVKSHNRKVDFTIPQRKFMGNSSTLNKIIQHKIMLHYKRNFG